MAAWQAGRAARQTSFHRDFLELHQVTQLPPYIRQMLKMLDAQQRPFRCARDQQQQEAPLVIIEPLLGFQDHALSCGKQHFEWNRPGRHAVKVVWVVPDTEDIRASEVQAVFATALRLRPALRVSGREKHSVMAVSVAPLHEPRPTTHDSHGLMVPKPADWKGPVSRVATANPREAAVAAM